MMSSLLAFLPHSLRIEASGGCDRQPELSGQRSPFVRTLTVRATAGADRCALSRVREVPIGNPQVRRGSDGARTSLRLGSVWCGEACSLEQLRAADWPRGRRLAPQARKPMFSNLIRQHPLSGCEIELG